MSTLTENSSIAPICPVRTAEVVSIVREAFQSLSGTSVEATANDRVGTVLRDGLASIGSGIRLLMLQRIELTDSEIIEVSPESQVRLRCLSHEGAFASVSVALEKTIRRDIGSTNDVVHDNHLTLVASIVLTNSEEETGQLSHPLLLQAEIDDIMNAIPNVDFRDQVRFLEKLEEACLNAHDAGATVAGVARRNEVDGSARSIRFRSMHADSEEHFRIQELECRDSEICGSIRVRQHDVPR